MREEKDAAINWAQETRPDIIDAARLVLVYLAGLCDPATGRVEIAQRSISRRFHRHLAWPARIFQELETAGLVLSARHWELDGRRNVYTLTGASSAWTVTIPLIHFLRHEFYALQFRVAELEAMLPASTEQARHGR